MARTNLAVPTGFVPLNSYPVDPILKEVQSNNSAAIYPGEPVILQTDGTVLRTPAGSAAGAGTDGIYGVCTEIIRYKNSAGQVIRNAKFLPASTTWTGAGETSQIMVMPAIAGMRFRVRGTTSGLTIATARSLSGENADHLYGTADTALGLTGCALNIATHAVTATLQWRIVEVVDVVQNDPTQINFILDVIPNLVMGWPVVGGATLGV